MFWTCKSCITEMKELLKHKLDKNNDTKAGSDGNLQQFIKLVERKFEEIDQKIDQTMTKHTEAMKGELPKQMQKSWAEAATESQNKANPPDFRNIVREAFEDQKKEDSD